MLHCVHQVQLILDNLSLGKWIKKTWNNFTDGVAKVIQPAYYLFHAIIAFFNAFLLGGGQTLKKG